MYLSTASERLRMLGTLRPAFPTPPPSPAHVLPLTAQVTLALGQGCSLAQRSQQSCREVLRGLGVPLASVGVCCGC